MKLKINHADGSRFKEVVFDHNGTTINLGLHDNDDILVLRGTFLRLADELLHVLPYDRQQAENIAAGILTAIKGEPK